jgi:hypothetical protein
MYSKRKLLVTFRAEIYNLIYFGELLWLSTHHTISFLHLCIWGQTCFNCWVLRLASFQLTVVSCSIKTSVTQFSLVVRSCYWSFIVYCLLCRADWRPMWALLPACWCWLGLCRIHWAHGNFIKNNLYTMCWSYGKYNGEVTYNLSYCNYRLSLPGLGMFAFVSHCIATQSEYNLWPGVYHAGNK